MLHKLIQNIKEQEPHYFVNPVLTWCKDIERKENFRPWTQMLNSLTKDFWLESFCVCVCVCVCV